MKKHVLKARPVKDIKKLASKYAGLKLIPKIGVTVVSAAIIGGLVGGIYVYNIKSVPVSLNQTKSTTTSTRKSQTTQPTKSVGSSTPSSTSTPQSNSSSETYCPNSNGQIVPTQGTNSCSVFDLLECSQFQQTTANDLFTAISNETNTIYQSLHNLEAKGDYNSTDLNQVVDLGNSELNGLYETYVQDFKPPYPNCSPQAESVFAVPTISQFPASYSNTSAPSNTSNTNQ